MSGSWDDLAAGVDCPFDAPRPHNSKHWNHVATLSVSSLYLTPNQAYRGYCLLIFDPRHATRPNELAPEEWQAWCSDLYVAQRALVEVLSPDHINVAALGNEIPHLHWHIIPRYVTDPRWGKPVWATNADQARKAEGTLTAEECQQLVGELRTSISQVVRLDGAAT